MSLLEVAGLDRGYEMKYNCPALFNKVFESGYSQEGYLPILSFSDWKSNPNIEHTERIRAIVANRKLDLDEDGDVTVSVDYLQALIDEIRAGGGTEVDISVDDTEVVLGSRTWKDIPRGALSYKKSYQIYYSEVKGLNLAICDAIEKEKAEREQYMELFRKYGPISV